MKMQCSECSGTGINYDDGSKCPICKGSGEVEREPPAKGGSNFNLGKRSDRK